ncbi:hypothetical protein [Caulobacter sp. NIBR1757]|uniref:hypothetical protein n=1 Tax=Caulobacter sp. NIBR1757 TaxID=3016000 RepID=UPI0022F0D42D|nr:hypothetical protein [Caulobacter sp. NIBR1757]WGM40193.1 hypothetical protein AMEJIAPC_03134 [Caulobacter sp. NIBR1757]
MRLGLILLLIGLPGAALAAEDRYGPSRSQSPPAAVIAASSPVPPALREPTDYRGRTLSWAGKPVTAAPRAAPVTPAAIVAAPPPVLASRAPEPSRLPTSLYDAPAPAAQPAAAGPQPTPPSLPPPPSPPPLAGTPNYGYSAPRSYSVVREWGGTPDRIPTPPAASQFSGREVALDPGTLGAAQQPDPASDDEADEEQAQQQRDQQQRDQQQKNLAKQATKDARK